LIPVIKNCLIITGKNAGFRHFAQEVFVMRRGMIVCSLILISGVFLFGSIYAEEQKYCPLCGMNLQMFRKTNHWLTFSDGTKTGYCSIHCAAIVYQKRGGEIDHWEVADYDTGKLFDARAAYFLVGSDLPGTMTPVSKLAFNFRDVAEKYQDAHGGKLVNFDEALRLALEGLGEDMTMIKEKVAKMSSMGKKLIGKHGCTKCHGEGGAGGSAISWRSTEFAKSMDNRVKIKEAILNGSHKMEGYKGKINEKELHAITLYIWTNRAK
jgi:nitrous oxide reductase accessory protein NosL